MLNGQTSMPITSLRYFIELVEEVGQTETPRPTGSRFARRRTSSNVNGWSGTRAAAAL